MQDSKTQNERIAITGLGLVTPVGRSVAASVSAMRSTVADFKAHETVLAGRLELHGATLARVSGPGIPPSLTGADRALALLVPAIKECTAGVSADLLAKADWRVDNLIAPATDDFVSHLKAKLPDMPVPQKNENQQSLGRCSFFENIIQAVADLQQGKTRAAIVGCVDSLCALPTLEHLNDAGKLKSAENPEGIIPGEAAGAVLLEREADARTRKSPILAYVNACGRGTEPNPWIDTKPSQAKGLTDAFREALAQLAANGAEINLVIADMNGERARSLEWGLAETRVFRSGSACELLHPADCAGDCGGAMGTVMLALGATSSSFVALSTSDDAGARRVICLEKGDGLAGVSPSARSKNTSVTLSVIEQHVEEASFLWLLRNRSVRAPHITTPALIKHDARINAHLDGLRIAGDAGWDLCAKALAQGAAGECFTAAVLAFESNDDSRIQLVLDKGSATYKLSRGIVSALGWLSCEKAEPHIKKLLSSPFPEYRRMGIAASAIHREDPGDFLIKALSDNDSLLRARALKAAGELGKTDLISYIQHSLTHPDERCRFWAAWSVALLGNASSLPVLKSLAASSRAYQEGAVRIAFRRIGAEDGLSWQGALAKMPETSRLAVIGAGVMGDPVLLPWVIEQMSMPSLSRIAGEAFTLITGVDLSLAGLEGKKPEGFEFGPNDDPNDDNVEMDPDDGLPWPNPEAIKTWFDKNKAEYKNGVRSFMGKPIAKEHLQEILKSGYQRQREAAAHQLAILNPGQPLYETRGPGSRQKYEFEKRISTTS